MKKFLIQSFHEILAVIILTAVLMQANSANVLYAQVPDETVPQAPVLSKELHFENNTNLFTWELQAGDTSTIDKWRFRLIGPSWTNCNMVTEEADPEWPNSFYNVDSTSSCQTRDVTATSMTVNFGEQLTHVAVFAHNSIGWSPISNVEEIVYAAPSPPANFRVVGTDANYAAVAWDYPSDGSVYSGREESLIKVKRPSQTTCDLTNRLSEGCDDYPVAGGAAQYGIPHNNDSFEATIFARHTEPSGTLWTEASNLVSYVYSSTPAAPTLNSIELDGNADVLATMTANSQPVTEFYLMSGYADDGTCDVTQYLPNQSDRCLQFQSGAGSNTITIPKSYFEEGVTYKQAAFAVNGAEISEASEIVNFTMPVLPTEVPVAPVAQIDSVTSSVNISWTSEDPSVTEFKVVIDSISGSQCNLARAMDPNDSSCPSFSVPADQNSYSISLTYKPQEIFVYARNLIGWSVAKRPAMPVASSAPLGAVEIHLDETKYDPGTNSYFSGIANGTDRNSPYPDLVYSDLADLNNDLADAQGHMHGALSEARIFKFDGNGNPTQTETALDWVDMSDATVLNFGSRWDIQNVPIGFSTQLYGREVNYARIGTSGGIAVGNSSLPMWGSSSHQNSAFRIYTTLTESMPKPLTSERLPFAQMADYINGGLIEYYCASCHPIILAGAWYNTDISLSTEDRISYKTIGTAPNREFVVEFYKIPYTSNSAYNISSQIKISESGSVPNEPPTVALISPEDGSVFEAPANVTLEATAEDTDGIITQVEFYLDDISQGIDTTAPYSIDVSGLISGIYGWYVVAMDNDGDTATSDTFQFISNDPPTLNHLSPKNGDNIEQQHIINVNGTVEDPENQEDRVEVYLNDELYTTVDVVDNKYSADLLDLETGEYILDIIAYDNYGGKAEVNDITFNVYALPGQPEISEIIHDEENKQVIVNVIPPDVYQSLLIKKGRVDDETCDVTVWENTPDCTITGVDLQTFQTVYAQAYFEPDVEYKLAAWATNSYGRAVSEVAYFTRYVNLPPTVELTAPAMNEAFIREDTPVEITFSAEASDPDGTVSQVEFFVNDGSGQVSVGVDTTAPYSVDAQVFGHGLFSVRAIVTDDGGATGQSSFSYFRIMLPPLVEITYPEDGQNISLNDIRYNDGLDVTADAEDRNVLIQNVEFYLDGVIKCGDNSEPYTCHIDDFFLPIGSHELEVIATDNSGLTASDTIIFNVTDPPPTVSITSPSEGDIVGTPGTFFIDATAADNNEVVKVEFFFDGALIFEDTSSPYYALYPDLSVGDHYVSARATDDNGSSTDSEEVNFVVRERPEAPYAQIDSEDGVNAYVSWTSPEDENIDQYKIIANTTAADRCDIKFALTPEADAPDNCPYYLIPGTDPKTYPVPINIRPREIIVYAQRDGVWSKPSNYAALTEEGAPEGMIQIHHTNTDSAYTGQTYYSGITNGYDGYYNNYEDYNFRGTPRHEPFYDGDISEQYNFVDGEAIQSPTYPAYQEMWNDPDTITVDLGNDDIEIIPLGFKTKIYGREVDRVGITSDGLVYLNDFFISSYRYSIDDSNSLITLYTYSSQVRDLIAAYRVPTLSYYDYVWKNTETYYCPSCSNVLIAGKWVDLDPLRASDDRISYKVTGEAPNRVFTIDYYNIPYDDVSVPLENRISVQIQIYETGTEAPTAEPPIPTSISQNYPTNNIVLTWDPPVTSDVVPVDRYFVRYRTTDDSVCTLEKMLDFTDQDCPKLNTTNTILSINSSVLVDGKEYEFVIFASSSFGISEPSDPSLARILYELRPPSAPVVELVERDESNGVIKITSYTPEDFGSGPVTTYDILWRDTSDNTSCTEEAIQEHDLENCSNSLLWPRTGAPGVMQMHLLEESLFDPYAEYEFRMYANNDYGTSPVSEEPVYLEALLQCTDADGDGYSLEGGECGPVDCNDENAEINPDASEICDGVDNDCDDLTDEDDDSLTGGYEIFFDADGDTYGDPANSRENQCETDEGYVENGDDCDDTDAEINPGSFDVCDIDHEVTNRDCNEENNTGSYCEDQCGDRDSDTFVESLPVEWNSEICPWVVGEGDCNDLDPLVNPEGIEVCNEYDDDCDALIDEDDDSLTGAYIFYLDSDGDGFGDPNNYLENQCVIDEGYVDNSDDCDDSQSTTYPGAPELCDNVDNDCSGTVDEYCPASGKQGAISMMQSADTSVLSSQDLDRWSMAKQDIFESLGNRSIFGDLHIVWYDSDEIECQYGHKVFDHEKQAVDKLEAIDNAVLAPVINTIVDSLIEADRIIAETAINAMHEGKQKDQAWEIYLDAPNGKNAKHIIQSYRDAWKKANRVCDVLPNTPIEEISLISPETDGQDIVSASGDLVGAYETRFETAEGAVFKINTSSSACIKVGAQLSNGWTVNSLTERAGQEGTLAANCAVNGGEVEDVETEESEDGVWLDNVFVPIIEAIYLNLF